MKSAYRNPILRTKLYKTTIKDNYIFRKRIVDELENNRSKHLTLIVAAAGYGKSVIVSEWMDCAKAKHCWISLDEELNDLRTFLSYLICAVESVIPESLPELSKFLEGSELPGEKILSNYLINELDELGEELILVLDDYHFINNQQIHNLVDDLLKYFPRKFHLVIIARRDPPLNLSSLKSYGNVNELRMSELSFDKNEVISLANNITGIKLSDELVDNLLKWTEGWIVGLRLALLTMNQDKNVEKILEEIKGDKHYLTEFLLNEVFLKVEEDVKIILLAASLVERFNEDLLKEMVNNQFGKDKSAIVSSFENLFDRFRKSTLFIIPLDNNGTWFRYHHFFKEFLLKRLDREYSGNQVNELHKKASEYFDKNELFDEALKHSLKSGDINLAVKIVEKNKYKFIETDQFGRLSKCIEKLPTGTVEKHLGLLLARAFLYDTVNDFASMRNDLILAEKLIAKNGDDTKSQNQLLGEFYAVSSNCNFNLGNFEDAYKHSIKATELLTDNSAYLRDNALAHQAFSLNAMGKFNDAIFILKDALRKLSASESISRMRNLIIQSLLYAFQGNLPEIMKLALEYHSISIEKKLWVSLAYSTYYLSATNYQWNNLDEAVDYASTLADFYYGRSSLVLQTLYTKAFALNASRKIQELNGTVSEINEVTKNLNKEVFNNFTRAFEVELSIRQNDIATALEIANRTNFDSFRAVYYFYFPQMTVIKLLMSTDEPDKIAEAEKRVKELIDLGRTSHRHNVLMQALLLQSLLFSKKDNFESSVKSLKEAIKLAEPGGFIRIFIDLGEPMKKLLQEVYRRESDNNYISKLLQAFERETPFLEKIQNTQEKLSPTLILNGLEKLSGREINLLKLISEGYRNKEIADQLHLSIDSIKKYLYYIYQKLGVRNRVAAILKATELGLINQSRQLH